MKPKLILFFFFLSFFVVDTARSQPATIVDSLYNELERAHDIDQKIDIYLALSNRMRNSDLNSARDLANRALVLASKSKSTPNLGLVNASLGEIAVLQDSSDLAAQRFKKATEYLTGPENIKALISVYLSIGNRYIDKDNYAEAMNYYLKGISLSKDEPEKHKLANLLNNLGIVYLNINKPTEALDLYSRALELFSQQGDTMNVAGATANIGSIYIQLGQYDIAGRYYNKGYQLFKKIGSTEGMAHAQLKLGLLSMLQQKYDSAALHLDKSLKLQQQLDIIRSGSKSFFLAETYINLGIVNLELNRRDQAEEFLLKGYDIVKQTEQYRLISQASESLSSYYKATGNPYKALDFAYIHNQYADSTINEESIRKLAQLEMQYRFDIKQSEAEAQRMIDDRTQERTVLIYIIVSISLLFLLILAVLLLRLEKARKKKVESESRNLSDELDYANKELTTHVMYLMKKNEFIISIAEKLRLAKPDIKNENKKIIGDLISELESNSTMVSWEEFEIRFQKVYTGFYDKLNTLFPDLTPNELRLCAFFRLNMTTKEIAAITYQSLNSITVARYRLRKKLGMETNEHLVTFLSTI